MNQSKVTNPHGANLLTNACIDNITSFAKKLNGDWICVCISPKCKQVDILSMECLRHANIGKNKQFSVQTTYVVKIILDISYLHYQMKWAAQIWTRKHVIVVRIFHRKQLKKHLGLKYQNSVMIIFSSFWGQPRKQL